jgi:8-oxo-dGTP pyrophosphatase MutT (NUDIX family)
VRRTKVGYALQSLPKHAQSGLSTARVLARQSMEVRKRMVWRPRVTVAAVIENRGRFLMVEEHIDGQTVYNQPAGHLEDGESLHDAVIRETLEETTGHFTPEAVIGIYRWIEPVRHRTFLRVCFTGQCTRFDAGRSLAPEILRTRWMTRNELDKAGLGLRSPMVLRCIDDYLTGIRYPLAVLADLADP